jgi:formate-dependent nitrite reductase membrane component NrfD
MTPLDRIRIMQQGRPDFSVGPKLQTTWGFREGAVFATEGLSATVMMLSAADHWLPGMIGAEVLMILVVVLLFSHLGNPKAAWRAMVNFRRSWISRGTTMIGGFVGLGALAILIEIGFPAPAGVAEIVFTLQAVTAAFIVFYPGFAMAASAGIPFWTTGALPILSALGGLSSGAAAALALVPFGLGLPVELATMDTIVVVLIAATGAGILAQVSAALKAGAGAKLSARLLVVKERLWFWTLAVGFGLAVPAACIGFGLLGFAGLYVAAAGRFVGDVALRHAILKVGTYEALL